MNETEWRTATDPNRMLHHLRDKGGERKLRLFACACCRRVGRLLEHGDPACLEVLARAEEFADGVVPPKGLRAAATAGAPGLDPELTRLAWDVALATTAPAAWPAARLVARHVLTLVAVAAGRGPGDTRAASASAVRIEARAHCELLRDLFAPLFRPVGLRFAALSDDQAVLRLSHTIYQDRSFRELPILADALEEAGCADEEVLDHCRDHPEHARGCWVVDALVGKG